MTITAASQNFTYDGSAHSNAGYDVAGLVGNDAITAVVEGSITFPSESPVKNEVKSHEFTTGTPGNYSVSYVDGELTMSNASVAITITAASDSKTYDGTALTNSEVTVTSGALMTGDELVAEATGSATNVADTETGNNPVKAGYKIMHGNEDVTANYVITTAAGTLTINPVSIVITADSDKKVYDGTALTKDSYKITTGAFVGEEGLASVTVTGSQTLVGSSDNTITGHTLKDNTKAENYSISYVKGTLTVTDGEPGPGPDDPPIEVNDDLVVTKADANADAAKAPEYKLGEEVTFEITATNIYDEAKTITLSEIEGVKLEQSTFENVAPGETIETTATYKITEADILEGSFTNTVTAAIDDLEKTAEATVNTEKVDNTLSVVKKTTSKPENGEAYALGETITYEITVTNEGNVTITGIEVEDKLNGNAENYASWSIKVLAPGASETFTVEYAVTKDDINKGSVTNAVTAAGIDPNEDPTDGEDEVVDPTRKTVIYYTNYPVDDMENVYSEKFDAVPGYQVAEFLAVFTTMPSDYNFVGWKDINTGTTYTAGQLLVALASRGTASLASAFTSSDDGTSANDVADNEPQADVTETPEEPQADFILYAQWTSKGGSNPRPPKDEPTEEPEDNPDEEIPEEDTPLAPAEEEPEEIPAEDTPLAPYEEEPDEAIDEEPTPFSPYTGDDRHTAAWGFVSLLSLAGIVVLGRKRREE